MVVYQQSTLFISTDFPWINGRSYGSAMVPLDRVMATSYGLSKVNMFLSAAVWPQFWMQCCCLQLSPTCAKLPYRVITIPCFCF